MGHDRKALKRAVNLSLNSDLVRQARTLTPNLSETIESLLAAFVDAETARRAEMQRQIDALVEASNRFIAQHGAFGDEFSTL
ncbi:MAG TPA: type II toxin-antitoxin system CcdA family antitoxin [Roseomonas sp.]|jgi:antitoxin CcdA